MQEPTGPQVPTPPLPEGKRDHIVDIFLQSDGILRPGWRFLLYVLIALALLISVPVAINLPDSWPGAVLVLSVAAIGAALIVAHLRLGHRARRSGQIVKGERNAF